MTCAAEKAYLRAKNRREFNELLVDAFRKSGMTPDDFVSQQAPFVRRMKIDPSLIPILIERA